SWGTTAARSLRAALCSALVDDAHERRHARADSSRHLFPARRADMTSAAESVPGPHGGARIATTGQRVEQAAAAMLLLHGRGGSAADILGLARELDRPQLAYLAPEAVGRTWYPH